MTPVHRKLLYFKRNVEGFTSICDGFFQKISELSFERLLLISIIVYVLSEAELACEVRTVQRLKRASLTSVKTSKSKHVLTGSKHRAK